MDLMAAERLLDLWGKRYFKSEYAHLGYGETPLARLLRSPGGGAPAEIEEVHLAVDALSEVNTELAQIVVLKFGHGMNSEDIGHRILNDKNKPTHRNTVDKKLGIAVAWVAGRLSRDAA